VNGHKSGLHPEEAGVCVSKKMLSPPGRLKVDNSYTVDVVELLNLSVLSGPRGNRKLGEGSVCVREEGEV